MAFHIFLITTVLLTLTSAKPYANYGFYSPYPPPSNQIIYDFQPVNSQHQPSQRTNHIAAAPHRSTRDLTWKAEYDALIDGHREPTCEELREMWTLAREMQKRRQDNDDRSPFMSFKPVEQDRLRREEQEDEDDNVMIKADRRRMSTPSQRRSKPVYGTVKTHAPPPTQKPKTSSMHVRDPAKEIYGMFRDRNSKSSSKPKAKPTYGTVKEYSDPNRGSSYLEKVKAKLYKDYKPDQPKGVYAEGVVRHYEPEESKPSAYDAVRALVAANRAKHHNPPPPAKSAFDEIKERLMGERLSGGSSSGLHADKVTKGGSSKAFRRKNSKKRRRNRRRKNKSGHSSRSSSSRRSSKQQSRKNRRKWRMLERERLQRQQRLLQQLG